MLRALLAIGLATATPVFAQVIDTLGSTAIPATTGSAKANLLAVNDSRLLTEMEWYLDIPAGTTTLTFFVYRHHSRNGFATQQWTLPVTVTSIGGPAWYSTGPIALELAGGNHYALGIAYSTPLTYYFSIASPGAGVSFGNWQRGMTPIVPLPSTLSIGGSDAAQYHQRLTTFPVSSVVVAGTGCGTGTVPRLVAGGFFHINATQNLDLVDGTASTLGAFALATGATLPAPVPLFGCDLWLNLTSFALQSVITAGSGSSVLPLAIPNVPALVGSTFSSQAILFPPAGPVLTNGVQFTIQ